METKYWKMNYDGKAIVWVICGDGMFYQIDSRCIHLFEINWFDTFNRFEPATKEECMTAFYATMANLTKKLPL